MTTFKKVSVLVPTRGRSARLRRMLASYTLTTRGVEHLSELVFRIDDDDGETYDLLSEYTHLTISGPRKLGYASTPDFYNEMARFATGDVLMCGNDDMVFRSEGWAKVILEAANEYPDGLFDFGVKTHNEANYPFATVSRKVVERLGFIFDPRIFWGDMFLRDVMAWFGRTVMLPSVIIDHDWAGNDPDAVFKEGNHERFKTRGAEYWHGPHLAAVNEAVQKLQGMIA